MTARQRLRASCAVVAAAAMLQSQFAFAESGVVLGHPSSAAVAAQALPLDSEPVLTHAQKLALLQQHIKYVFVLFQENRSFDFHLGTFPGANGLFSQPAAQTPGFVQPIVLADGTVSTISPFLIPATTTETPPNAAPFTVQTYPADTDSIDHSHNGIVNSMDVVGGVAKSDRYALDEEGLTTVNGQIVSESTGLPPAAGSISEAQVQKAELAVSHIDCQTVPFLWEYADRFTLFDNFHQTVIGPSTPNAIAMIAGQSGLTQWALHPAEGSNDTANPVVMESGGEPVTADPGPFAGSNFDTSPIKPPYGPNDESPAKPGLNQTYASLPLSFMGSGIAAITARDENPAIDLPDVQQDIPVIAANNPVVQWGWFQEGYDHEATDGNGPATYASYITHHNGPQYFGYIGDNKVAARSLHGLGDFFTDISSVKLPKAGGVFYVRGGYNNQDGLTPLDPNPTVQANFPGNDDHPGYSDAEISEGLLADEVNAIAASPYWRNSAIIISYDETDGLYDHAPSKIRAFDPEGNPLEGGPRIPTILISPYARAHTINHNYAEHSSVIRFINELFNLTPLGKLPNEVMGQQLGMSGLGQAYLGPADALPGMDDLFGAFDNRRLMGMKPRLPAEYATIPASALPLPHYNGKGCLALNIVPTDYVGGTVSGPVMDPAPADFNPRPNSTPGNPAIGTFVP